MNRRASRLVTFGFACCIAALGQGVPYSAATLQLTANNTQAALVSAHSNSTLSHLCWSATPPAKTA